MPAITDEQHALFDQAARRPSPAPGAGNSKSSLLNNGRKPAVRKRRRTVLRTDRQRNNLEHSSDVRGRHSCNAVIGCELRLRSVTYHAIGVGFGVHVWASISPQRGYHVDRIKIWCLTRLYKGYPEAFLHPPDKIGNNLRPRCRGEALAHLCSL